MGEGLSEEEMNTFLDLACEEGSDKVDIRKISQVLLPKLESVNMLATRGAGGNQSQSDIPEVDRSGITPMDRSAINASAADVTQD